MGVPNERLRRAMVRAGHSAESLAEAAGYNPKQVGRWVAEGVLPRRSNAKATVAGLLGEHSAATGQALSDLALATGSPDEEALSRLRSAIDGFGDDYAQSRVHAQVQMATLLMTFGDPAEAIAVSDDLLPIVPRVRSQRTHGLLAELHDTAISHANRPDVADLRDRLAQVA